MKKTNYSNREQSVVEKESSKQGTKARPGKEDRCEVIKLGVDVHAIKYVVARMCDAQNPQPAQSFTPEAFLEWVKKQLTLAKEVHAVYEAGPFGYGLCRQLRAMGVKAHVIQPQHWDERKRSLKTDKSDAKEMVSRLDRFVAGNKKALNLVRLPTEEEEVRRNQSRYRESLKREHQRVEAMGRTLLLTMGIRITSSRWWRTNSMKLLSGQLEPRLMQVLAGYHAVLEVLRSQLLEITRELQAQSAGQSLPKGLGPLTDQQIDREICDWHRFKRAKQVGSYTGLCPSENSTGERQRQGRINKYGNPALRAMLIEAAWRLVVYQPDYPPVKWFHEAVSKRGAGYRKKAITAVARRLAVDLWKAKTGRCALAQMNLKLVSHAQP